MAEWLRKKNHGCLKVAGLQNQGLDQFAVETHKSDHFSAQVCSLMFWLTNYKLEKEPLKVVTSPLESKSMKTWLAFNPSERYAKVNLDHENPNVAGFENK